MQNIAIGFGVLEWLDLLKGFGEWGGTQRVTLEWKFGFVLNCERRIFGIKEGGKKSEDVYRCWLSNTL